MPVTPATIRAMKEAVEKALSTDAGNLLRDRLVARFDEVLEGKMDIEDSIKRTKTAIRIFIDQRLADKLDRELRQLAGLAK